MRDSDDILNDDDKRQAQAAPPTPTEQYLKPILEAAELLQLRVFPSDLAQLTAVLDQLSRGFPGDVMPRLEALRALTSGTPGSVDELAELAPVWPDWSGDVRYKLTATTLTWCWSSKHSGRYATITVPFPTVLPLTFEVVRFTDMDDQANHGDECDGEGDCYCEADVEQTVSATVHDWTGPVSAQLAAWLSQAVIEPVEPAEFGFREAPPQLEAPLEDRVNTKLQALAAALETHAKPRRKGKR